MQARCLEVTICDLKERARRSPHGTLRFHRIRGGDAVERAEQRPRHSSQHRDHACVWLPAADARVARGAGQENSPRWRRNTTRSSRWCFRPSASSWNRRSGRRRRSAFGIHRARSAPHRDGPGWSILRRLRGVLCGDRFAAKNYFPVEPVPFVAPKATGVHTPVGLPRRNLGFNSRRGHQRKAGSSQRVPGFFSFCARGACYRSGPSVVHFDLGAATATRRVPSDIKPNGTPRRTFTRAALSTSQS